MEQQLFPDDETIISKEVLRKRVFASLIDYVTLLLFTLVFPVVIGERISAGYKVEGILAVIATS